MKGWTWTLTGAVVAGLLAGAAIAGDDFAREGKPEQRAKKDPLEKKAPPKLEITKWVNTVDGKALELSKLRGKVVVLDFWGVW